MSYWGGYWGGGRDAVGALWLRINRDVPNFGAIGDVIEVFADRIEGVAGQIESAYGLDTAVGAALDVWGALLGVPRLGLIDEGYRRLIQVQAVLVLSGPATREKAIRVFELWTQVDADEYRDSGRTIEIGGDIPPATEARLLRLMRRVTPAARRFVVYSFDADALVSDYALDPVGTTTITDYALDPVTGASITAEPVQ